jgi:hypothetical protein
VFSIIVKKGWTVIRRLIFEYIIQNDHSITVQEAVLRRFIAILMAYRVSSPVPLLNITTTTVDNLNQVAAYQNQNIQCQNTRRNTVLDPPIMIEDKLIFPWFGFFLNARFWNHPQAFWTSSIVIAMWSNPPPGSALPFT